jgi:hypothetical protein
VKEKAVLGMDIQVVFTNQENVAQLTNAVEKYGVNVMNFATARYLLWKQVPPKMGKSALIL